MMQTHNNKKVFNLIILDESGSMESIKGATVSGFNETIQAIEGEAAKDLSVEQYINFYTFNGNSITEVLPLQKAHQLPLLNDQLYRPQHLTPLYDAMGLSLARLRHAIAGQREKLVLVTILTDGHENASKEFSHAAISALIKELKAEGWVFTYMGANHNVETVAMGLGINNYARYNATPDGVNAMLSMERKSRSSFIARFKDGILNSFQDRYFDDPDQSTKD